jgi:hypothetical protein
MFAQCLHNAYIYVMASAVLVSKPESSMANQNTYSHKELQSIKLMGGQYLVVSQGDIAQHKQGDAISWHRTYEAANKHANESSWYGILSLDDALTEARQREHEGI